MTPERKAEIRNDLDEGRYIEAGGGEAPDVIAELLAEIDRLEFSAAHRPNVPVTARPDDGPGAGLATPETVAAFSDAIAEAEPRVDGCKLVPFETPQSVDKSAIFAERRAPIPGKLVWCCDCRVGGGDRSAPVHDAGCAAARQEGRSLLNCNCGNSSSAPRIHKSDCPVSVASRVSRRREGE